jgi:hypothetical protein
MKRHACNFKAQKTAIRRHMKERDARRENCLIRPYPEALALSAENEKSGPARHIPNKISGIQPQR